MQDRVPAGGTQAEILGRAAFCPFAFILPETCRLLFTRGHANHTEDGKGERWKGSVFLTALWGCWPSYLFKPMFLGFLLLAAECVPDQFTDM